MTQQISVIHGSLGLQTSLAGINTQSKDIADPVTFRNTNRNLNKKIDLKKHQLRVE